MWKTMIRQKKIYEEESSKIALIKLHIMALHYQISGMKNSGLTKFVSAQDI